MVDTTNNIRLRLMTQDQFRTIDPQEVSSGTPTHYVPWGYGALRHELSSTGTNLWVASTSAADTTQHAHLVAAFVSGTDIGVGYPDAPLAGLTRVACGNAAITIQQFQLDAIAVGFVSLFDAAVGGNTLSTIPPGFLNVQYEQIRLWPTPAGAYAYQVDGPLVVADFGPNSTIETATPVIPADFQYILADYARMREYEYRDDSRFPMAQLRYQEKLKELRNRIMDPPDFRPRVGRVPDRSSNLGSYYPPGRW
jgi:hypothetical protein